MIFTQADAELGVANKILTTYGKNYILEIQEHIILYLVHITGTRIQTCGIDGLSRRFTWKMS